MTASPVKSNKTMIERLRMLPRLFDLDELAVLMNWNRRTATVAVAKWRDQGVIEPLASHGVGIYFNLIKDTNAVENCILNALVKFQGKTPVILGGITALSKGGWTTQVSPTSEVIIPVKRGHDSIPYLEKAHLLPRYPRWYSVLVENSVNYQYTDDELMEDWRSESEIYAEPELVNGKLRKSKKTVIYYLPPALALADAMLSNHRKLGSTVKRKAAWSDFGSSDIDEQCVEDSRDKIVAYMVKLGASEDEVELLMSVFEPEHRMKPR
jgi:hypothetical protein